MGYTHLATQVGTREEVNRLSQKIEKDGYIIVGPTQGNRRRLL